MPKAVVVRRTGDVEQLRVEEIKDTPPSEGQLQIRHTAIGINHTDINHRKGIYNLKLPFVPGTEAAGVVTRIGAGVEGFKEGDRVVYATGPIGSYREVRNVSADYAIAIPDSISDIAAAAVFSKGLMAHTLARRAYIVVPGSRVLVHAATGAVAIILIQWAKHMGGEIIGTVGVKEKEDIARRYGCDHVINYKETNFVEEIKRITDGEGLPVVYDPVGRDTFYQSLSCLHLFGTMVSYGQTSGPVMPINLNELSKKSLFLTRPNLKHYKRNRLELVRSSMELFDAIQDKIIRPVIGKRYEGLENVANAHTDIETRRIIGSAVITLN
ncbi:MAG: quinone oxidoreductase [Rickettsiales bacterium]|nr:quinone oxidoreductase [Rickettsiales bacterium]